jgi:response regulator of citrate/malate metabolism
MINCIIIDDEPLAVKLLENHISKIDSLKLVATAKRNRSLSNIADKTC